MSFEADHKAIENRFEAQWGTETKIAFENMNLKVDDLDEWVRLVIIDGDSAQIDLSDSPTHRRVGVLIIQIFTRPGKGTKRAEQLGDLAAAVYRSKQFSNISCKSAQLIRVGQIEDWYQVNVEVPFYVDTQF